MGVTKALASRVQGLKGSAVLLMIFVCLILPYNAMADEYISSGINYYKFEGLTVIKPMISLKKEISLNTTIQLRGIFDNVETETTSSVDAVSGATKTTTVTSNSSSKETTDLRKNLAFAVAHAINMYKIEAGYDFSREDDYASQTPFIAFSRDFFERNTTLTIGYAYSFDNVMGEYMESAEDKDTDSYSVSLTQFISTTTVGQIGYTFSDMHGYLGTGNRKVVLSDGSENDEYLPDSKKREAVGVRLAQYITPADSAVHISYRWYRDNWHINSNTYGIQYYQYVGDNTYFRLEYRYYNQDKAFFYKDSYSGSEQFMTSSNLYSDFDSHLYGVKLVHYLRSPNISTEVKYERYHQSTGLDGDIFMFGIRYLF